MATEVGGSSRGRELRSWWTVGGRERGGKGRGMARRDERGIRKHDGYNDRQIR